VKERVFGLRAAYGFWRAQSLGDDVALYVGTDRETPLATLHFQRQQKEKNLNPEGPYYCLADFVAPKNSGREDCVGAFAVTSGHEVDAFAKKFREAGDDYSAIIVQALGDRMAEALAEFLHKKARDILGFGRSENLTLDDILAEKYRGIRPAQGYPSCPDHEEKRTLWKLLDVEKNVGSTLTENLAMNPPGSVCGLYFAHPESRYFDVNPIGEDQIADYRRRKGLEN